MRSRRRGRLIHRSVELPDSERTVERGVPTTTVARTLLDLGAVVPTHHLRRAIERSEQAELFDLREVRRVLDTHPGRPGRRPLMALLADFQDHGDTITRSDLEAVMLQICIDYNLPRPQVNRYDGVRESDFRWPDHRLIVEVDSWTFHGRQILADAAGVARELTDLLGL
jgi:hypothetical protein